MSTTQIWNPAGAGYLEGTFRGLRSLVSGVETDDGSFWLLDARAEAQLMSLHPREGQRVRVTFRDRASWRASNYDVTLR